MESHPKSRVCYIKPLPAGTPSMQTFQNVLLKRRNKVPNHDIINLDSIDSLQAPIKSNSTKILRKSFKAITQVGPSVLSDVLTIFEECRGSRVFEVMETSVEETSTFSFTSAPGYLT